VRATFGAKAAEWTVQVLSKDGRASNVDSFQVVAPEPRIDVMRPVESTAGTGFTLTVYGSTLSPASVVRWNGEACPTTPIKSSEDPNALTVGLKATIPADAVTGTGRSEVRVYTRPPGGGLSPPKPVFVNPRAFYRTPWFFVFCIAGLVIVGVGFHRWRLKTLRQRELRHKVEERTRALREEKERTEEQAERLEAMDRARSRLFRDFSHELRTPLTMVTAPLRDAVEETDHGLPDDIRDSLRVALRNAERLETLVDRVLSLSRLETGRLSLDPQPGDLVGFARETTRAFEPMAERQGVQLRCRADPDALPSVFDPEKLRSVLGNLIENALEYTPEKGKVMVQAERASESVAALHVSDTGTGISDHEISDLFDRFHRGEAASASRPDGSGLGLALAKELTELHGGTIEVESEVGMGSTFTVKLPIREPEPEEIDERGDGTDGIDTPVGPSAGDGRRERSSLERRRSGDDGESGASDESSPTVLVVEDNADVRTYLRTQLSDAYCIQEVQDGEEALDTARADPPDLILSDVMMPGIDGLELCRRVKDDDALRDVPVVLLTAKVGEKAEVDGLNAGADAHVEKPFSMETLRARIQSLIESRAALRDQYRDEVVMQPSEVSITSEEEAFYEEARDVVEAHIGESGFTVERFAGGLSVSRSTLRRRLKDATDQTPAEFVRHLRLVRAAQLLREDSGLRVYEVADAVGYESPDHFGRLFREHFGISPSEYPPEE
jgi:signal transduction histidine kinase/DNA-binding NarL/FixJ family response regulator